MVALSYSFGRVIFPEVTNQLFTVEPEKNVRQNFYISMIRHFNPFMFVTPYYPFLDQEYPNLWRFSDLNIRR